MGTVLLPLNKAQSRERGPIRDLRSEKGSTGGNGPQIHGSLSYPYIVHERPSFTPWRVCVKKDDNQHAYFPAFRTGWEDGGEVEIFTLLASVSDMILVQVRIYTKANYNEKIPSVARPDIAVECGVPAFVFIEQEHQRVLIQLMCKLVPVPEQHTMCVEVIQPPY